jgi:hypothetical protein
MARTWADAHRHEGRQQVRAGIDTCKGVGVDANRRSFGEAAADRQVTVNSSSQIATQ